MLVMRNARPTDFEREPMNDKGEKWLEILVELWCDQHEQEIEQLEIKTA